MRSAPWPDMVHLAMAFDHTPIDTAAATFSAPILAKAFNVTEESIKAVVERLDGAIF